MIHIDAAIIGGTGIGERLMKLQGHALSVPTTYGMVRGKRILYCGKSIFLLQRHSAGHKTPPHRINYRGMAEALQRLGVQGCLSSAAVGSLRPEWVVGTLCACTDFLDFSGRRVTMYDHEVQHVDFTDSMPLHEKLSKVALTKGKNLESPATYLCSDGPRYETPAEIKMMDSLGADLVGMTASSEAICMHEAGIPYGCIAVVTNLAAGLSGQELQHGEVSDAMKTHGEVVTEILLSAAIEL